MLFAQRQTPRHAHRNGSRSAKRVGRHTRRATDSKEAQEIAPDNPQPIPPTFGFNGTGAKAAASRSAKKSAFRPRRSFIAGQSGRNISGLFSQRRRPEDLSAGDIKPNRPLTKTKRRSTTDPTTTEAPRRRFSGIRGGARPKGYGGQSGSHETRKTRPVPGTRGSLRFFVGRGKWSKATAFRRKTEGCSALTRAYPNLHIISIIRSHGVPAPATSYNPDYVTFGYSF